MRAPVFCAVLAVSTASLAAPARHAAHSWTPVMIGTFGDWKAAYHPEAGVKVCYAYTFAKSSHPTFRGRGDVVLTIAQRPHERDSVAVSVGYAVLPHAGASVTANGQKLHFYLEGRSAFAPHGAEAIAAFGGGREAVGRFPGPRNMLLVDTFSLNGFAAAYAASLKECPQTMNAELTAAERDRILAKAALFNPPPPVTADGHRDLVGMSRTELAAELAAIGEAPFRVKQLWHWIYHQGVTDFSRMSSIARPLQEKLGERFVIGRPAVATQQTSTDDTRKWLFRFRDGQQVETVYIPDPTEDRGALCISSQVGCTLSCRFCHTGTQTLVRNLGAAEIVGQFMAARDAYGEWPSPKGETPRLLSTIVLMGMGEPLYNYENVAQAMKIVMDNEGIALSRRRITLSTSGVVPIMDRAGAELGVNLAVSLHAVRDDLRNELVPLNRKYPIAELLAACRRYPGASNARRITFEYVMLRGINDTEADARELVRLIAGMPAKVNLIPFNPWPGSTYEPSSGNALHRFAKIVMDAGYASPIRTPRGRDILAACGQLKTDTERKRPGALPLDPAGDKSPDPILLVPSSALVSSKP